MCFQAFKENLLKGYNPHFLRSDTAFFNAGLHSVTLILGLENLIEKKHYKLARSHRTGLMERELKPNPETRNRLTAILAYPITQPLTSEEQAHI